MRAIAIDEVDIEISMIGLELSTHSKDSISTTDATGIVITVGAEVNDISIGDRAVVCGIDGLETHTRAHKSLVRRVPNFMSLSVAAALPSALCAAESMMIGCSKLQPHETILICGLPGTLQQTLISFATHIGADIFVTSETPPNRRLLEDCFGIQEDHNPRLCA